MHGHQFAPTHYTWRHFGAHGDGCLRNWNFEGWHEESNSWVVLRRHTNDKTLNRRAQAATWDLPDAPAGMYFSRLRVIMTAPNDRNSQYIAVGGFEVYGVLKSDANNESAATSDKPKQLDAAVEYANWAQRERNAHFGDTSVLWYIHAVKDIGTRNKPSAYARGDYPSAAELNVFCCQYFWLLLRCVRASDVLQLVATPKWLNLLLGVALGGAGAAESGEALDAEYDASSVLIRTLCLRISQFILPLIHPDTMPLTLPLPPLRVTRSPATAPLPAASASDAALPPLRPPVLLRQESEGAIVKRQLMIRLFEAIGESATPMSLTPNHSLSTGKSVAYDEVCARFGVSTVSFTSELVDLYRVLLRSGPTHAHVEWSRIANELVRESLEPLRSAPFQKSIDEVTVRYLHLLCLVFPLNAAHIRLLSSPTNSMKSRACWVRCVFWVERTKFCVRVVA